VPIGVPLVSLSKVVQSLSFESELEHLARHRAVLIEVKCGKIASQPLALEAFEQKEKE